jgi:hypothetical protein
LKIASFFCPLRLAKHRASCIVSKMKILVLAVKQNGITHRRNYYKIAIFCQDLRYFWHATLCAKWQYRVS